MIKVFALVMALFAAMPAFAQQFPGSQPIRIIVPFAPGGTTDLLGRAVGEFLQKRMNHTVIVENRPGAAMTIGTDLVARSPADGHTILLAAPDLVVVPAVRQNMPYDIEKLTYLTRVWVQTALIVTGPKSGINTIEELIAEDQGQPGPTQARDQRRGCPQPPRSAELRCRHRQQDDRRALWRPGPGLDRHRLRPGGVPQRRIHPAARGTQAAGAQRHHAPSAVPEPANAGRARLQGRGMGFVVRLPRAAEPAASRSPTG